MSPKRAMVLAAGLGQRMRPLTETTAKPLLTLQGRSLLDQALDRLEEQGIAEAVVNAHWHAEKVARAVAARSSPAITLQQEETLLETGGGVTRALPLLGPEPFFVVNGDSVWLDGPTPALARMAAAFDPAQMDALLLLVRAAQVEGEIGRGDFLMDPLGRLRRPKERELAPYVFAGVQILTPALFAAAPAGAFSLNRLYDHGIEAGRLFGLVHDGVWFHLSAPEDLERAEAALHAGLVKALF
ncbi:nucleotidyltransferase family protein [Siccirubricoccus sp. KC 17139]|uniref:Nucleotidyltransferase family protein n=1 Tax=Siccirubricoccus soli TaxID=2899147 RepID=A0ABT1DD65_9PROT|nr:nucleotidyltransferase family protein [Siccirubricoccus soli]MCO6419537.1 nucleotidyltransferase family protein [Siccirubricoccus soli]MCP2685672.1 nucleotidyltransferase family protein [Siccirubricoccus soli]